MSIKTIVRPATQKELEDAKKRLERKNSKQVEKPTPANP